MSRRRAPGAKDRHGSPNAKPVLVANGKRTIAPPPLRPGQKRCAVCKNSVSVTERGFLRVHRDLFGEQCRNKSAGRVALTDVPDVVIPATPAPPTRVAAPRPETQGQALSGLYLSPTGACHDCGKWVPGERRYCGQCARKRSAR